MSSPQRAQAARLVAQGLAAASPGCGALQGGCHISVVRKVCGHAAALPHTAFSAAVQRLLGGALRPELLDAAGTQEQQPFLALSSDEQPFHTSAATLLRAALLSAARYVRGICV